MSESLDEFMIQSGIVGSTSITAEAQQALCDAAEAFLRSGISDYSLWCSLSPASRVAFIAANELIWRERAAMIGMAAQSELSALLMVDDDGAKDRIASDALTSLISDIDSRQRRAS